MMPRRSFLCRTLLGIAGLAVAPSVVAQVRRPSLWIADSDPGVAFTVQLLARRYGLVNVHIIECKTTAIKRLQTGDANPSLLITDYVSGNLRGNDFIRLARHAAPDTKVILFSAVVGNLQRWIAAAGSDVPRPHAFVEKPSARKLMTALCQML